MQYSSRKRAKELVEEGKGAVQENHEEKEDINPTTAEVTKMKKKQRPALEIIGTSSTKGSTELKQATENEEVDDYMYMKDDVSEEDKDEDEDDEDTTGYDDEDEDVHYTNEGNLAIQGAGNQPRHGLSSAFRLKHGHCYCSWRRLKSNMVGDRRNTD